jgi:multiple sugar transport system ATP-binding protein
MAVVAFDCLSKRFGATIVADELSLEIADGEFFVFLGPSGCGKSTLLHVVAGIEPPSGGRVRIGAADVTDLPPQKRDVAMVFQSYALYPHLDVFDNLAFPLRARGIAADAVRREVERVGAALGLGALLRSRPRELSGGQRQRVALGRALIRKPVAFLMDEPLSNLDVALRLEIREEIKRVHQSHRVTTLYVTHDQEEAMALADRIAVLREGRVQQCDTPARLYARPANAFVAHFVGTPPMNLVPARALAGHPGLAARLGGRDPARTTVGVRPHELEACASPHPDAVAFEPALVEPAGAETWVVGSVRGARIRARFVPGEGVAPGASGHVRFRADAAHLFDASSGARVD